MKKLPTVTMLLLVTLWLSSCTTPTRISAADIYEFEDTFYPQTSWDYYGYTDRYHLFDRYARDADGVYHLAFRKLAIPKRQLEGVKGFRYNKDKEHFTSTDVEVHADFIRIHIDGEPPVRLTYKSEGFITADRRGQKRTRKWKAADSLPSDAPEWIRQGFIAPE